MIEAAYAVYLFVIANWKGILAGLAIGYAIAKVTATSPFWEKFGEFIVRRMEAYGEVSKVEVKLAEEGQSPVLSALLDRIQPKEAKRVTVGRLVTNAIAEKLPGVGIALRVRKGIGGIIRRRRERRKL